MKNTNFKIESVLKPTYHRFHMVDPSPWPLLTAFSAFTMLGGATLWMHRYEQGLFIFLLGLLLVLLTAGFWWRDIIREATFEGQHTEAVQKSIRLGMLYFIISEALLFSGLFWAFFHSSLAPSFAIGGVWPPMGITPINPWEIPLLNTFILLTSGATLTWAHHAVKAGSSSEARTGLAITLVLAAVFTLLQLHEYQHATFSIADSVYGSTFFLITDFHGSHVLIGTLFLTVSFLRILKNHFTRNHHTGFLCAIWYWHFVDIVWILVFCFIYWWGS